MADVAAMEVDAGDLDKRLDAALDKKDPSYSCSCCGAMFYKSGVLLLQPEAMSWQGHVWQYCFNCVQVQNAECNRCSAWLVDMWKSGDVMKGEGQQSSASSMGQETFLDRDCSCNWTNHGWRSFCKKCGDRRPAMAGDGWLMIQAATPTCEGDQGIWPISLPLPKVQNNN